MNLDEAQAILAKSARTVIAVNPAASPDERKAFMEAKAVTQQARTVAKAEAAAAAALAEVKRLGGAG